MQQNAINNLLDFIRLLDNTMDTAAEIKTPLKGTKFFKYFNTFEKQCLGLYNKIYKDVYSLDEEGTGVKKKVIMISGIIKADIILITTRYKTIESEMAELRPYISENSLLYNKSDKQIVQAILKLNELYSNLVGLAELLPKDQRSTGARTVRLFKNMFS